MICLQQIYDVHVRSNINILQQFNNRQTRFQYQTIEMIMTVMVFEMISLKK